MTVRHLGAFFCWVLMVSPAFAASDLTSQCLPQVSLPINVRIAGSEMIPAVLEGGLETPLSLTAIGSGRLLWSAGADPTSIQQFDGMDAGIAGSLVAIDLDADGVHDRLYVGDMAARLWRLDLQQGATAAEWATGGILADFSNHEGRSFLAAADVSWSAPGVPQPYLQIAIGTAAPGNPAARNRFYVLREREARVAWSAQQYAEWHPWQEQDLTLLPSTVHTTPAVDSVDPDSPGWYVELSGGHIVAPSVTVQGRTTLLIATALPREGPCEVFARIASVDTSQQALLPAASDPENWQWTLPGLVMLDAGFVFTQIAGSPRISCSVADQPVMACDVDTRTSKTWWLRTDAE